MNNKPIASVVEVMVNQNHEILCATKKYLKQERYISIVESVGLIVFTIRTDDLVEAIEHINAFLNKQAYII